MLQALALCGLCIAQQGTGSTYRCAKVLCAKAGQRADIQLFVQSLGAVCDIEMPVGDGGVFGQRKVR